MADRPNNRLGLFFKSKNREGLMIGRVRGDELNTLIETIKAARTENQGIVLFLWRNTSGQGGHTASMTVGVDRPLAQSGQGSAAPVQQRRITQPAPVPVGAANPFEVPDAGGDIFGGKDEEVPF